MATRTQTAALTAGTAVRTLRVSFPDDLIVSPTAVMFAAGGVLPPGLSAYTADTTAPLPGTQDTRRYSRLLFGTPTVPGTYQSEWLDRLIAGNRTTLTILVQPAPSASGGTDTGSQGNTGQPGASTPAPASVRLSWFQARAEAVAGVRIRRAGWVDRYVEYDRGLWFLQLASPTTKVLGARRVIRAADWTDQEFRATDWTFEGIVGQSAIAGTPSAAVDPALRFP